MWRDVLTVIGFVFTLVSLIIAIFTWLEITPSNLQNLMKDRLIRNWLILPITITTVGSGLIVFYIIAHVTTWWSYAELAWLSVNFWLFWAIRRREAPGGIANNLITFAPVVYLVTNLARINNALNASVFDSTSPAPDKWILLGLLIISLLVVGINLGLSLLHSRLSRLYIKLKSNCVECKEIRNKAEKIVKTAEEMISSYEKRDKPDTH